MEKRTDDRPGPELRRYALAKCPPDGENPGGTSRYERSFFRSCRYFTVGHQWFAATREGGNVGPCSSVDDLEPRLAQFLTSSIDDPCDAYRVLPREGDPDATTFKVLLYELCICKAEAEARSEMGFYAWATQRLEQLEDARAALPHAAIRARALRFRLDDVERD